jgi:hypothetical protein
MEPLTTRHTDLALAHIEQKLAAIEAEIWEIRQFIHYCTHKDTPSIPTNDEL